MTFEPLKNSYQTFQITVEFKVNVALENVIYVRDDEDVIETVCLWCRQTRRMACYCTVVRTNTVEEILLLWP